MTAGEWLTGFGRVSFKIVMALALAVIMGIYTVIAIGAAILGASLSKH